MGFWLLIPGVGMGGGTATAATTADGVDYAVTDNRPHYAADDNRPNYVVEE